VSKSPTFNFFSFTKAIKKPQFELNGHHEISISPTQTNQDEINRYVNPYNSVGKISASKLKPQVSQQQYQAPPSSNGSYQVPNTRDF
jgi:hypothetical protein